MPGRVTRHHHSPEPAVRPNNRIVLCFDGTGNAYQANTGDTNVVKLLEMLDRSSPRQMHYYQPGIGTYSQDASVNQSIFGKIKQYITLTIDSGLATSFEHHVIAGYRFLMRYYGTGDRIYIFGFSRGAFTARFLARMVAHVGLLSMGNEEMVPAAYKVYQDYIMAVKEEDIEKKRAYMTRFRAAFCRHDGSDEEDEPGSSEKDVAAIGGIQVHFLGLFDTVSSVGTFDTSNAVPPSVHGTAKHVRHAVALDERRVKFKAALLHQDKIHESVTEDHKEVWFPGNHGDIGGGWVAEKTEPEEDTWWQRMKAAFKPPRDDSVSSSVKDDKFQLSDLALKWMIDEIVDIEEEFTGRGERLAWDKDKDNFLKRFNKRRPKAITSYMHDTLSFGKGSSWRDTILWKFMEYLPFFRRWEFTEGSWQKILFPLNMGGTRDIPPGALFHRSVMDRMMNIEAYNPRNQIGKDENHQDLSLVHPEPVHDKKKKPRVPHFRTAPGYEETDDQNKLYVIKGLKRK